MGADIKNLRIRIKSVRSTQHLTKAMGLVASSKIKKANEAMAKSREYSEAISETIAALTACRECEKSPYMQKGDGRKIKLVVIAGDRGLAGGYNANVFRMVRAFPDAEIIPIGKRASDKFGGTTRYAESFSYDEAQQMSISLCDAFSKKQFDRLGIVYTKYISMMTQETEIKWVLPLEKSANAVSRSVLFEPDEMTVFRAAIPEYIAGILFACVKESVASEVSARRVAMDAADKNAQEMLSDLSLAYNRARQGAITQEITEIVAGSGQ